MSLFICHPLAGNAHCWGSTGWHDYPVGLSSSTRVSTCVITVLTVVGVALISMVVQVNLGPCASVLATPVRHAVKIRSTLYTGIHAHPLDQIGAHPKLEHCSFYMTY